MLEDEVHIFTNPPFANEDDLVVDVPPEKFESSTLQANIRARLKHFFLKSTNLLLRFSFVKNYTKEITNLNKKVTQKLTIQ